MECIAAPTTYLGTRRWAICPHACTPASVREAPTTLIGTPYREVAAFCSSPCTVLAPGFASHPLKPAPAYCTHKATVLCKAFTPSDTLLLLLVIEMFLVSLRQLFRVLVLFLLWQRLE